MNMDMDLIIKFIGLSVLVLVSYCWGRYTGSQNGYIKGCMDATNFLVSLSKKNKDSHN